MIRWPVLLAALWMAMTGAVQPRTLAGTWTLTAEAITGSTPNGGSWGRDAIAGTVVIELKNGAVTGTWTGPKGEPWPFMGQVELALFEFTTTPREMPVTLNGRQGTARFRWRFRGENDHDTLRGTMVLDREGEESNRLQPFTATRRK